MFAVESLLERLKPDTVYRRADLELYSNSIDRHLKKLQETGRLKKIAPGMYYYPKKTTFGASASSLETLVQRFLKDDRFLVMTPNMYNTLGLGLTQLYNKTVIYNHKRHGVFTLAGKTLHFVNKPYFPLKIDMFFLMVDFLNNLQKLGEDQNEALSKLSKKAMAMGVDEQTELALAVKSYGGLRARKYFSQFLKIEEISHG